MQKQEAPSTTEQETKAHSATPCLEKGISGLLSCPPITTLKKELYRQGHTCYLAENL